MLFASTLLYFFCPLKFKPFLMDISGTCFLVSLMNFHLENTPNKVARSIAIFCLKQGETIYSGFPLFGPPQRNNQSRITDGVTHSFAFKLPYLFRLCLLGQRPQTNQGRLPDSAILLVLRCAGWD
jgi:hypothetical protein